MPDNHDSVTLKNESRPNRDVPSKAMGRAIGGSAEKARRIAAAQGVDDIDSHALAGFIEAEGSFGIVPNNGGRSWLCAMTLTQRADDADMLVDIARVTGLGRLHGIAAQRTSRPQVSWSVCSKLECRELVRLLREYPLRGRKRREFAVWASAVDRWASRLHGGTDAETDRLMRASRLELRGLRRYVNERPPDVRDSHAIPPTEGALRAFLGGFFTGEGSFSLDRRAVACIHLRADDAPLLRAFADTFGIGRLGFSAPEGHNPTVRWSVCRQAELLRGIALLDAAVLRGRKRREFEAWRVGAAEYARGRERDEDVIAAAATALADARAYAERETAWPVHGSGTDAYADILRAFATEVPDGALTCTAYALARERHPEWPTRNTIAAAFGTWEQALGAAGLAARASPWRRVRRTFV